MGKAVFQIQPGSRAHIHDTYLGASGYMLAVTTGQEVA